MFNVQIGDILPPAATKRGFWGDCIEPRWHCAMINTSPAAHTKGRDFFRAANMFAFYPSHELSRRNRFTQKPDYVETPLMPGYLFAQFMLEPNWDIWERLDWFIAPFKVGSDPYSFRYQQIRHLQGLSADAVRLADAQSQLMADIEAASRPRAGKPAIFISGPFAGMTVHIAGIEGAEAILTLMGMPVRATVDSLKNLG